MTLAKTNLVRPSPRLDLGQRAKDQTFKMLMRRQKPENHPSLASSSSSSNSRSKSKKRRITDELLLRKMIRKHLTGPKCHYLHVDFRNGTLPSPRSLVGGRPQAQPPRELLLLLFPSHLQLPFPVPRLGTLKKLLISLLRTPLPGLFSFTLVEELNRSNSINPCLLFPQPLCTLRHNTTLLLAMILLLAVINLYLFL